MPASPVDIAGYPIRGASLSTKPRTIFEYYATFSGMVQRYTGYRSAGNYELSSTSQKLAQTALFGALFTIILSLPGERFKTVGIFDWQQRGFSRGSKQKMKEGDRRMTRGASVFFDSEEFQKKLDGSNRADRTLSQRYRDALLEWPLLTKAFTSASLAILGDLLSQYVRTRQARRNLLAQCVAAAKIEGSSGAVALQTVQKSLREGGLFPFHKAKQTMAFAVYGLLLSGPAPHYWYAWLDSAVPTPGGSATPTGGVIAKKLLLDRLLFAPPFVLATMLSLSMLNGGGLMEAVARARATFGETLVANWKLWTPAQLLNFMLVPPQWRVLFANAVAFVWNIALSASLSVKN